MSEDLNLDIEDTESRLKDAFLSTGMEREEIIKEVEEDSRTRVVQKYYPDLGIED